MRLAAPSLHYITGVASSLIQPILLKLCVSAYVTLMYKPLLEIYVKLTVGLLHVCVFAIMVDA